MLNPLAATGGADAAGFVLVDTAPKRLNASPLGAGMLAGFQDVEGMQGLPRLRRRYTTRRCRHHHRRWAWTRSRSSFLI
jgi:hypothetical protein